MFSILTILVMFAPSLAQTVNAPSWAGSQCRGVITNTTPADAAFSSDGKSLRWQVAGVSTAGVPVTPTGPGGFTFQVNGVTYALTRAGDLLAGEGTNGKTSPSWVNMVCS